MLKRTGSEETWPGFYVQLLSSLLMEADHIDQELLDLILTGLLPPKCTENPALARYLFALRFQFTHTPTTAGVLQHLW